MEGEGLVRQHRVPTGTVGVVAITFKDEALALHICLNVSTAIIEQGWLDVTMNGGERREFHNLSEIRMWSFQVGEERE